MTDDGLRYRSYRWRDGDEWLTEVGEGSPILFLPPLFEELNRCRALMIGVMRVVAQAGFRAMLPDLPGTGESPRELGEVGWDDWTGAVAALASEVRVSSRAPLSAAFRGGCLLEGESGAARRWRFSPVAGGGLVRDLVRAKQAASSVKSRVEEIELEARASGGEFAGYALTPTLFAALSAAPPPRMDRARVVRLANDAGAATLKIVGRPLWRQAEPGTDLALSEALGRDIAAWARMCAS